MSKLNNSTFTASTDRVGDIAKGKAAVIEQLNSLFAGKTRVYIDYANVKPWSEKLQWHVDTKRLMQFLKSFDNFLDARLYQGTLVGDPQSEKMIKDVASEGYEVITKPVKIMRQSIDASSVNSQSPELLKKFIRRALLRHLDISTVEYLNGQIKALNIRNIYYIQDMKCNFDVEIGVDMLLDLEREEVDTYVLWSGDSDFADSLQRILDAGKKAVVFASPRLVAHELNELKSSGLFIFDIQKIKEFICWKRELVQ